jgi:predicted nucleic acid-binding protein
MPMKLSPKSIVAEKWVINASPVIALARVGQVELLARLPEQAILPQAVVAELSNALAGDPARQAAESGLFKIVKTPAPPATILAWDLGKGETSVLAYALAHPGCIAVLDDGAARRCARSLALTLMGTLAVVILAKQHGLVKSAAQVLQDLRSVGFRLDDAIIRDALARAVGETWELGK